MITWKASCNIPVCISCSKMDAMLTGRSYCAYGESFPVLDSEYANNTAIRFEPPAIVSDGVSSIIQHFARFGTEIHTGLIHPTGKSKADILFCSKSLFMYDDNPKTLDDVDLSDVIVDEQSYIRIFDHFKEVNHLNTFSALSAEALLIAETLRTES